MTYQYMEIKIKELEKRIKALEQKPKSDVLDKIRAEIEQEYKPEREHHYGQGLRRALEIIDKYRIEGEDISEWNKCINEVLEVIDKYKAEMESEQ